MRGKSGFDFNAALDQIQKRGWVVKFHKPYRDWKNGHSNAPWLYRVSISQGNGTRNQDFYGHSREAALTQILESF